ncbi:hypothetical protein ACIBSR_06635 [Streptomyces sp. NPDC049936]|uniref:hypothetical protein n=1 Tax=Streptomyces sp. NPDC049936 TaxID=3365599 RepID=UPI003795DB54
MSPLAPTPDHALRHRTPARSHCLTLPHIAPAFAKDSHVRELDADGIEGVLHEPADRSRAVVGLHNPSATKASVNLHTLLPECADRTWHFLSGSMHTSHAPDGTYLHLAASDTVWLTATP